MNTRYEEVYGRFLGKIRDYTLLDEIERDKDFVKSILHDYLLGAIANFTYSPKNLKKRNDELEHFESELSNLEIEILAKLMIVEYLSPIITDSKRIEFQLNSKDFRTYSPTNLMRELGSIQERERSQATELMVENHYRSGV